MSGTRRSARVASSQNSQASSPPSQNSPSSSTKKRKAETGASPSAKRGKTAKKEQKTIEESMDIDKPEEEPEKPQGGDEDSKDLDETSMNKEVEPEKQTKTNGHSGDVQSGPETKSESKEDDKSDAPPKTEEESAPEKAEGDAQADQKKSETDGGDAVEASARDAQVPSSILEKGILYFVYRGRVNIDDPKEVEDIARSYIIMRPLPHGAKLGDGPIGDDNNCRLLAVPKKTLPLSGNDKWTAFVEKANSSFKDLKDGFLKSNDYATSTQGTQHTPPVTPAAEGVYAMTSTGRETHLAYIITLPTELGEVQRDLGVREKGSFITSVKNPKAGGPASADLGSDPGYSTEILNEFRSLRWAPLQPKHLNYESCQFLMIGEGEKGLEKATEPQKKDVEKDKDEPKQELEQLEEEDEIRVKHLDQEDAVFADLGTDSKSYPGMQTTW